MMMMKSVAVVPVLVLALAVVVSAFDYDNVFGPDREAIMYGGPYNDYEVSQLFSICKKDDSVEAKCHADSDPIVYATSRAALRIQKNGRAHCTGWLVGDEGHVLTNWHCLASQDDADQMYFEAMAEGKSCATQCRKALGCKGTVIHSEPLTFLMTGGNVEHDYTLLQLPEHERRSAVSAFGYLKLRRTGPKLDERIYIPQHPRGWGKRIAMKDGAEWATIIDVNSTDFNGCGRGQVGYKADTQGGSSGSPVIAVTDNAVVAIHHCGGCSRYANSATPMSAMLRGLDGFLPKSAYV